MKKWLGAICSGIASILTFIFLGLNIWGYTAPGESEHWSGYELINAGNQEDGLFENIALQRTYRTFAIILIVLAALLALWTIFLILKNLNVIKINGAWIDLTTKIAISALSLVAIILTIIVLSLTGAVAEEQYCTIEQLKEFCTGKIGSKAGIWLIVITNAILTASAWVLPIVIKDKKA